MPGNSGIRERAESAFSKTQTQSLERDRAVSEREAIEQARDAKSARLKKLRLEKEAADRAAVADAPPKRTRAAGARSR